MRHPTSDLLAEKKMSHTITLSDDLFTKLQSIAIPFTDTPESVISRLLDAEIDRVNALRNDVQAQGNGARRNLSLDPDSHPSLTHTKVLSATVDGTVIHKPNWNRLLDRVHILARERLGSVEALRRKSDANVREGKYEKDGYHYLPESNISIQGVDSNIAWKHSLGLARALSMPIYIRFEWRDKEGAANPGKMAILEWEPVQEFAH